METSFWFSSLVFTKCLALSKYRTFSKLYFLPSDSPLCKRKYIYEIKKTGEDIIWKTLVFYFSCILSFIENSDILKIVFVEIPIVPVTFLAAIARIVDILHWTGLCF